MAEKIIASLIVLIAVVLGIRSALRTFSGKSEGCSCGNSGSCSDRASCPLED